MGNNISLDKLLCYILTALVVLYHSQGVFLPMGAGQVFLGLICAISIYYIFLMSLSNEKIPTFFKLVFTLVAMVGLGYMLSPMDTPFDTFKVTLVNFLPTFAFYYFAKNNLLTPLILRIIFLVLLPVCTIKFLQSIAELKLESKDENVVDNTVYLFIGLLPFVFFFKKKVVSFFFLLVLWYFMVQSAKRGAIVCGALTLGLYIFKNVYVSESKLKIREYIISFILLLGISYYGIKFYEENEYLNQRMEEMLEGDTSGRDTIAGDVLSGWYSTDSYFNYIFGSGYNASKVYSGHVSHNDWVDMLASYGFVGFGLFMTIFLYLIYFIFQRNWSKDKKILIILYFFIAVITSLTSRWYWSTFAYMQIFILPYILATYNKKIE